MFVFQNYDLVLVFLIFLLAFGFLILISTNFLGYQNKVKISNLTYESGIEPLGVETVNIKIRYYLFALVFVLFDVETLFLYPWATSFSALGYFAFIEALIFLTILTLGLVYAWKKEALEWIA